jgi:hypothetical protein
MGLTTALLEYARSVIERDLYDSSNWRSAATREELRQNLSAPFFHEKGALFTSLPHYSSNLPTSYSHLFDSSPGTTEAVDDDEVLPHPRLVVSRPRRLNLSLSLSLNAPPT